MNKSIKVAGISLLLASSVSGTAFADDTDWSNPQRKTWRDSVGYLNPKDRTNVQHGINQRRLEVPSFGSEKTASKPASSSRQQAARSESQPWKQQKSQPAPQQYAYQAPAAGAGDFPPSPKAGECYARVTTPATYKIVKEKVVTRKGGVEYETIPAKYEWVDVKVMVEEPREELKVIPATYKNVKERVMVKEPESNLISIPAEYETVSESVLVKPAQTVWKKGRGTVERVDSDTGEIMCLVEIPAEYKTVTKRVLRAPASTKKVSTEAVYETVEKRVIDQPSRVERIKIPARYETKKVKRMVQPPQRKSINIKPEYELVEKRVPITQSRIEWSSVLCETNATPNVIKNVQKALARENFYSGAADGVLDQDTMDAVSAYQKKKGLATGHLTMETVKHLGITVLKSDTISRARAAEEDFGKIKPAAGGSSIKNTAKKAAAKTKELAKDAADAVGDAAESAKEAVEDALSTTDDAAKTDTAQ